MSKRHRVNRQHVVTAYAYSKRGLLLAVATNSRLKTHPLQKHFAKLVGMSGRIYLHAEVAALIKAGTDRVHRLVITRYDRSGRPVCAAPCPICQLAIQSFGVKVVEHT